MSEPTSPTPGPSHQRNIFLAGLSGALPEVPTSTDALERAAEGAMRPQAWAYIAGGAGSERTMAANRAAFDRWRIVPRMLRDASTRDLSIELFGARLASPFLLAPIGVLEMAHPDADLAVARAVKSLGVPMIFSNQASVPMEQVAAALGDTPRWFQLYWSTSNALVESFVRRAESCGCSAIVLTLDTTMLGWRARDLDLAHLPFLEGRGIAQYTSDPVFRAQLDQAGEQAREQAAKGPREGGAPHTSVPTPRITLKTLATLFGLSRRARRAALPTRGLLRAVRHFVATYSRPSLTWEDLPFLRGLTTLPIVLKGIQHADDARRACDAGVQGIVVSNHGGRQVDGAVGSLDALPGVIDAVGGRMPVLFDSGIRTGADAFKALALGARAVLLGRPYAYGLAIAGEDGVRQVVQDIMAELDLTMGLAGHRAVRALTPDALMRDTSAAGQ
jgi:isopentenyl diphosphate isomerase/L-lactate dehydrogenase-like FMN-dependent dehydrogenase